ncbi:hypothetical protein [Candidatus Albibeggiatoa sp. nov. NOAA]|uniref:hypothetical protein n=1 Tax=Candidatus Albibeggiatoa sp. nov. NOAA TaxID=3162724 RepID=UPI0032F59C2B|nr:hypothetical protein [Thiotrichaceae bacterium]
MFKAAINFLLFCLLWLSFIQFPESATTQLDASWTQVLAHAFQYQWQAGIDYIWTYGSLGYFSRAYASFNPDLFYWYMTWWIILSAWFSFTFLLFSQKLRLPEKIAYFIILLVMISPAMGDIDALYFCFILTSSLLLFNPVTSIDTPQRYTLFYLVTLAVFALIALTKFTYFLLEIVIIGLIFIHFIKKYNRQIALLHVVYFLVILNVVWLFSGQSTNLGSFILQSLAITQGYSAAMSSSQVGQVYEVYIALAMISLIVVGLLREFKAEKFISIFAIAVTVFLLWKVGFTRHNIHTIIFFDAMALVSLLIVSQRKTMRFISGIAVLLAVIGHMMIMQIYYPSWTYTFSHSQAHLQHNITQLPQLDTFKQQQEQQIENLKQQVDLPQTREIVQQQPIDIFHPQQSVILLNQFNYQPRPIFQGYQAYSKPLLQQNALFYQSPETAPPFVLMQLEPIDSRFPTSEDSLVLQQLLWQYQFKLEEKDSLLLARKQKIVERQESLLIQQEIAWQQIIDISQWQDSPVVLYLDIQLSHWGKLQSFLYHPPTVVLELKMQDGQQLGFRLIPNMARTGFLLNPLLQTTQDVKQWYLNPEALSKVSQIRLNVLDLSHLSAFEPTIKLYLTQLQ